jgi:hypothetical protein
MSNILSTHTHRMRCFYTGNFRRSKRFYLLDWRKFKEEYQIHFVSTSCFTNSVESRLYKRRSFMTINIYIKIYIRSRKKLLLFLFKRTKLLFWGEVISILVIFRKIKSSLCATHQNLTLTSIFCVYSMIKDNPNSNYLQISKTNESCLVQLQCYIILLFFYCFEN